MISVIQRVSQARVEVGGLTIGEIGAGLLVLVCTERDDSEAQADKLLAKLLKLRIFSDDAGKMNRSVQDVGGQVLVVSQFTLLADARKGNRPSYIGAAGPAVAEPLYRQFVGLVSELLGQEVPTGIFGADMQVSLLNDGPVTIVLDNPS